MDLATDVVASVETPHDKNDDLSAPKTALTPPTSEEDMDKRERMSSELTDLEDSDDEEIEPDHYFEGGKIPVFKPVCGLLFLPSSRPVRGSWYRPQNDCAFLQFASHDTNCTVL